MAIFDLLSKRQSDLAKAGKGDVYQYDIIPEALRVQVMQLSVDGLGAAYRYDGYSVNEIQNPFWQRVEKTYCRELGLHRLKDGSHARQRVVNFLQACSTKEFLDIVELICINIIRLDETYNARQTWSVTEYGEDTVSELNYRMRQASVGYQFESGQLLRIDNQYVHAEVVKPALSLLSRKGFEGPQQEFLTAHTHYKVGEHRQAVSMAANALESSFKAIFDKKKWKYDKSSRISDLVKVAKANSL